MYPLARRFEDFLENFGIKKAWFSNLANAGIDRVYIFKTPLNYIDLFNQFKFSDTPEGQSYWLKYFEKWREYYFSIRKKSKMYENLGYCNGFTDTQNKLIASLRALGFTSHTLHSTTSRGITHTYFPDLLFCYSTDSTD